MKRTLAAAALCIAVVALLVVGLTPPATQAQGNVAYRYKYISTATTTTVSDGAGIFGGVVVNGGTAGAVTIYDIAGAGCTGTPAAANKVATIEAIGATNPTPLPYNVRLALGLCVLTAQNTDLTVLFN